MICKKIFLIFILFTSFAFSQETPCDTQYGHATAIPDSGWCKYAENLRKAGKPSASAECRCEYGMALEKEKIAKEKAERDKRTAKLEKENALNDKYQEAWTKAKDLDSDQIDEKISILKNILPVAKELDNLKNGDYSVSNIENELEYLERKKSQQTISVNFDTNATSNNSYTAQSSSNNTNTSQSSSDYKSTTRTTTSKAQPSALDGYYKAQQQIAKVEDKYDKLQQGLDNMIKQAFANNTYEKPVIYDYKETLKAYDKIRSEYERLGGQRSDLDEAYREPINDIIDFYESTAINQDVLTLILEKSKTAPFLYVQIVNSEKFWDNGFLSWENRDYETDSPNFNFESDIPPSAKFTYSQVYKVPLKNVSPYALIQYLNKVSPPKDSEHIEDRVYSRKQFFVVSTDPNQLDLNTEQFVKISNKINHISFSENQLHLTNEQFNNYLIQGNNEQVTKQINVEKKINEKFPFYLTLKDRQPYLLEKSNNFTASKNEKSYFIMNGDKYILITLPSSKAYVDLLQITSKMIAGPINSAQDFYDKDGNSYSLKRLQRSKNSAGAIVENFYGNGYFARTTGTTVPLQTLYYSVVNGHLEPELSGFIGGELILGPRNSNPDIYVFNPYIQKGYLSKLANIDILSDETLKTKLINNGFNNSKTNTFSFKINNGDTNFYRKSKVFMLYCVLQVDPKDNGSKSGDGKIKIKTADYGKITLQKIKDHFKVFPLRELDLSPLNHKMYMELNPSNISALPTRGQITIEEFDELYDKMYQDANKGYAAVMLLVDILNKYGLEDYIDPTDPLEFFNAGISAQQNGDLNKAEEFYQKTLDIDPNFKSANYNLFIIFMKDDVEFVTEINTIKKGMNSSEKSAADVERLKELTNARINMFKKALPYLERELELSSDSDNDDIKATLRGMYKILGEEEKADALGKL